MTETHFSRNGLIDHLPDPPSTLFLPNIDGKNGHEICAKGICPAQIRNLSIREQHPLFRKTETAERYLEKEKKESHIAICNYLFTKAFHQHLSKQITQAGYENQRIRLAIEPVITEHSELTLPIELMDTTAIQIVYRQVSMDYDPYDLQNPLISGKGWPIGITPSKLIFKLDETSDCYQQYEPVDIKEKPLQYSKHSRLVTFGDTVKRDLVISDSNHHTIKEIGKKLAKHLLTHVPEDAESCVESSTDNSEFINLFFTEHDICRHHLAKNILGDYLLTEEGKPLYSPRWLDYFYRPYISYYLSAQLLRLIDFGTVDSVSKQIMKDPDNWTIKEEWNTHNPSYTISISQPNTIDSTTFDAKFRKQESYGSIPSFHATTMPQEFDYPSKLPVLQRGYPFRIAPYSDTIHIVHQNEDTDPGLYSLEEISQR